MELESLKDCKHLTHKEEVMGNTKKSFKPQIRKCHICGEMESCLYSFDIVQNEKSRWVIRPICKTCKENTEKSLYGRFVKAGKNEKEAQEATEKKIREILFFLESSEELAQRKNRAKDKRKEGIDSILDEMDITSDDANLVGAGVGNNGNGK